MPTTRPTLGGVDGRARRTPAVANFAWNDRRTRRKYCNLETIDMGKTIVKRTLHIYFYSAKTRLSTAPLTIAVETKLFRFMKEVNIFYA